MKSKFFFKQFLFFIVALLGIFALSIALFLLINYNTVEGAQDYHPIELYNEITKSGELTQNAKAIMDKNDIWLIALDQRGDIIKSYRKPEEIQSHFELTDVARFTRWYLNDYPVFTYIHKNELLVIGYPKDYYAKIAANYFKPKPTFNLIKSVLFIIFIDLILLFFLYFYSKKSIWKEIKPIRNAIHKLSKGEMIKENDCNDLSEVLDELIKASDIIEAKNDSKNKWLRGITHDIRTPLTVIMAYSEELSDNISDVELRAKLDTIKSKVGLINKILESLNTVYLLEDKQELENERIVLSKLIKNIVIDYSNIYDVLFNVTLPGIELFISAREVLIERLIRNLIDNAIKHNDTNVIIDIFLAEDKTLVIKDNGRITEEEAKRINEISDEYDSKDFGYGLLIVKKIAGLYGINLSFEYSSGLKVTIFF